MTDPKPSAVEALTEQCPCCGCDFGNACGSVNARIAARAELAALRSQKAGAYDERNRLVALVSKLFPSSLERHPDEDLEWENDWRWIVFVDLPTGQASWHIHDSQLPMFGHLARNAGRKWDGHTNDEKYARLAAFEAAQAGNGAGT